VSLSVRFLPEAREEFDRATDWYADRGQALARDFVARVREVIKSIAAHPQMHALIHGDVRKAVVTRFPYIVLYREEDNKLIVVSVFHTSRNPAEWQSRVD
jgi:toxin ParE1/3/4